MKETSCFKIETDGHIAWLILNRPEKRNTMGLAFFEEIEDLLAEFDSAPNVRVVIIKAEGKSFSAGTDLEEAATLLGQGSADGRERMRKDITALQRAFTQIERCRKPVIAAIHGYCIGAGLDMVTACDIRLCSRDAVFSLKEAAVGFVADVGVLQRIPLIVGQGIARELAYTAKTIDAARAREILLVNEVFDDQATLMAGAQAMAEAIAANAPLAVEATKNVLNYGVGKSIDDGLRYVASMSTNIVPSKDLMEAFTAFMEKRPPAFTGQ